MKKALKSLLAAVGLMAAPGAAVASAAPAPVEVAPNPAPLRNTDARSTRYYVPKGTRKRAKSRVTQAVKAIFGAFGELGRNRFARRAIVKAAFAGRGRMVEGFAQRSGKMYVMQQFRDGKLVGANQSTRRCSENHRKRVWFERQRARAQARVDAARLSSEVRA